MTETEMTNEQYEARIKELENQLKEAQSNQGFDDIKQKYEDLIAEKDKTIQDLEKTVDETQLKVDDTLKDLSNEVNEKLKQSEEYKTLLATVQQLEKERAEATVDAYIKKGIILPTQKDAATKLCLNDNDTFLNLYRDAKPIVETESKRKSIPAGTAERIANYFKK